MTSFYLWEETAIQEIHCFRSFLKSIGMPINFEQLGAREKDIPVLVEKFILSWIHKTECKHNSGKNKTL